LPRPTTKTTDTTANDTTKDSALRCGPSNTACQVTINISLSCRDVLGKLTTTFFNTFLRKFANSATKNTPHGVLGDLLGKHKLLSPRKGVHGRCRYTGTHRTSFTRDSLSKYLTRL
jgi:hypothetical protein